MERRRAASRWAALGAAALLAMAAAARGAIPSAAAGAAGAANQAPAPEAALGAAARTAFEGRLEEAIAAVHPLASDAALPEGVRARANFLLGVLLVRAGRPAEATAALEAGAGDPVLADYALARLGLARRAAGDPGGAVRALARLLASYPASPLADPAWRDLGRAAFDAGDLPSAETALQEALAHARTPAQRADLQLLLAQVLARAGRPAEAVPLLRDLWLTLPAAREADRAAELLQGLPGAAASFTDDERFLRAMRLYRGGAYAKAARELMPFAAEAGARGGQARLDLGIARFRTREYQEAIRTLEPLLNDSAGPGRAEILFWLARCYFGLPDRARSQALLEELVAAAPKDARADDALFLLADSYIDDGRPDRAADALDRLIRGYPKSDRIDLARWERGWLWYRAGQYVRAAGAFRNLAARAPRFWAQATYWEARAEEAGGHAAPARRLYGLVAAHAQVAAGPGAYYAWLARLRLGKKTQLATEAVSPAPPQDRGRLPVARALAALWLADEATEEYAGAVRDHPDDRGLAAEAVDAALRLQRADRAVALAKHVLWPQYAQSGGTPPIRAFWDALYPQGYWNLVADRTAAQRLDPYLVLAVIREESAFAPQAVSPAGARGLMQLMPSTASRLAGAHRLPAPGGGLAIEEPWYNIALGAAELADLLDEFKGDVALALAAYNAGAHHVRRWIRERGYAGPQEFVEEIPFEETRGYVKRVLGSYDRYRALYAESQIPSPTSQAQTPEPGTPGGTK